MNKELIERLVEKRNKLSLNWQVPIEDEARWWLNEITDELAATDWSNRPAIVRWLRNGDPK